MDKTRIDYVDCRGQPGKFSQEPVGTPKRIKPAFDIRFLKDVYYLDGELAGAIPTSIELNIIDQRTLVVCGTMERAYPNDSRVPPSELAALENAMDAVLQQILGAIKKDRENPQDETAGIRDDIPSSEDAQVSSDGQSGTDLEVTSKPTFPREKNRQGEGSRQNPRVCIIPQLRGQDKGKGPAKGILRKPGSKNDEPESDDDLLSRTDFDERRNSYDYSGEHPDPSKTWVWLLAERKVGRFFRSFRFKRPINWNAAQSLFMGGLLLLKLPVVVVPKKRVHFELVCD
ncbi:hypothetical protein AtubIFM54640_004970 [Aspergillus tubingensis]|uniref:Uncharacterized protein n=1 Tax=Aspergillus tubingensis (strain CBS 134.48) TaxID=767770 RepID=A0A1L9NER6_ASPTC|nr:2OG-Fe(II) oxygenase family protein [Aspergillus tubingensis]OJI87778.1 hypothetical protein ASPTUDRAFT_136922 [Aspergillus tubingensis CBS 134.48]GFN21552.1 2OG-Fe(II) oxygenase family protein [Aspergillus tubingensis]GLA63814.1 hypothetical protein AtubIFM54640_004970 [Aspergillus tubingensis]